MTDLTRRTLLGSAAVTGAGLIAGQPAYGKRRRTRVTRHDERVVIIGSGFGGGVSALRLARAGVPVLVLERGKRWPTGPNADTFPTLQAPDKRILWYGSVPEIMGQHLDLPLYVGLLEAVAHPNMTILCASGVGGGSLAYQGMTLQPSEAVFNQEFPNALDWQKMNRVHYPRVARMLGIATAPDEIINSPTYLPSRVFKRNAEAAGFNVEKIPMPIDWNFALRELRGEMKPSYTNGDCALGVNNGGKHSIDVTYLAKAEATGRATVAPQHNVKRIARAKNGSWTVYVDRTDETGKALEHKVITTKALIMAAGSVNSTQLLLKAAANGDISGMPDELGAGWGSNADRIYAWADLKDDFGTIQGGPVVYGSKEWGDTRHANTIIQAALPPLFGLDARSTMLVGYGVSKARGKWTYEGITDDTHLSWKREADAEAQKRIGQRIRAVAGPLGILVDTNLPAPTTWHPMGGACMGTVCDLEGRVRGQRGLYVLDGALLPGSAGACNPSMTIAAVAERAMDKIVRRDVGSTI